MKNILGSIERVTLYFSQAIARIFSPNEEPVPEIGAIPFEGEPNSELD
ncbi:MAG: hypothetical protein HC799_11525 [Limnothrix sp. RL_2_0]|nr:hypothetical protein [Limnothrix sp. RL_2_0]